ncbi:hypothetical protein PC116_g24344 [Phytophthora cactorum]|nr:hypothetical protein C6341_g22178 [Phytophthora cactorum]KAG4227269.1 hypothetical protein PC116_g24344 [Phytophthora cactorum]
MAAKHVYLCLEEGDSSTNDAESSLSSAISEEVEEMPPETASSTHTKR